MTPTDKPNEMAVVPLSAEQAQVIEDRMGKMNSRLHLAVRAVASGAHVCLAAEEVERLRRDAGKYRKMRDAPALSAQAKTE